MDAFRQIPEQPSRRIAGVVVAPVVGNLDFERTGNLQVRLPWGEPTILSAPVVAPGAANDRGAFMLPKVGDNVVLAFQDGDARRPFVLGGVWCGHDKAPIRSPGDADSQYVIRTRTGQEIRIDEVADSITLRTAQGQVIECNPDGIQVRIGDGSSATALALGANGSIELRATASITLKAPRISIQADDALELASSGRASLAGDSACSVDGATVRIGH